MSDLWRSNEVDRALALAWAALDRFGDDRRSKAQLTRLLGRHPEALLDARRGAYLALLRDPEVAPDQISRAGWHLVMRGHPDPVAQADYPALASALTGDELALRLLAEAPVSLPAAERLLTRLRCWLLTSGQWDRYPALVAALTAQARLNEGAWPFNEAERAQIADPASAPMRATYLPDRRCHGTATVTAADPVTRAVTEQYEDWPYPRWTRVTHPVPTTLPEVVAAMDPLRATDLPVAANILVAGCGTGRHAAAVALRFPDASITAIDVSSASLDYARTQCAALGLGNVRFQRLDLHDVAVLGQQFHSIHCAGVLHHLPDPERGWRALTDVLAPNGVMDIMVYSKIGRLKVAAARALIADLLQRPVTADVLREARRRILERQDGPAARAMARSPDFNTLSGAHDLLLHRHEDPFDLQRIARCLDVLGLRLLSFELPSPQAEAAYAAAFPQDERRRDMASWISSEKQDFRRHLGSYRFWCGRKPAADA